VLTNPAGEFYGPDLSNIKLLARFFKKYPEYASRAFLSVKGGAKEGELAPDASPANLRRSVTAIVTALDGAKRLDLFECARVDPSVPVEDVMRTLATLRDEGLFDHIGMSECAAGTLRRACAVAQVAAVEIEVSLWSYEPETRAVIAAAEELGVAVAAYSPLGRGFLSGQIKSLDDLPRASARQRAPAPA
jgi:pyridoxine 4-dehydrogenase